MAPAARLDEGDWRLRLARGGPKHEATSMPVVRLR
jgi:hypothetical protein